MILSHRLWSNHFNSNRDLVGKDIRMNGEPYTVVGVLPPGIYDRFNSQLWVPLSFRPEQITHDSNNVLVMARLKDGVSLGQAQAEMEGHRCATAERVSPDECESWRERATVAPQLRD